MKFVNRFVSHSGTERSLAILTFYHFPRLKWDTILVRGAINVISKMHFIKFMVEFMAIFTMGNNVH